MASSRRDHLVDTAVRLFNRYGYHATGIDTILKEAGVAKMTLYNHFKSKDDLVVAALKKKEQFFADQYRLKTAGWDLKPRGRLTGCGARCCVICNPNPILSHDRLDLAHSNKCLP